MSNGLLIAIIVIFAWIFIIMALAPYIRKSKRLQLIGPLLMIKAIKRRNILDRIADRFPAIGFSKLSVVLVLATGIFSLFLLLYGSYLGTVASLEGIATSLPLSYYVGLPGINPIISITYGIPAFIVAVVIHEMFHGIVARKHKMTVNSVGTLFFVVPMGAFVEPDEEEMKKADPVVRRRIFAAGAGINMVIAFAALLLLSFAMMPAATPIHNGVYVQEVTGSSPLTPLVSPGDEIVSYHNYSGNNLTGMFTSSTLEPGHLYNMTVFNGKSLRTVEYPAGVMLASILKDYPADNAGIKAGSIVYSMDNITIHNPNQLLTLLDNTLPGTVMQVVTLNYSVSSSGHLTKTVDHYNMTTVSKYSYYAQVDPAGNSPAYKNQSFMGITESYLGVGGNTLGDLSSALFLRSTFHNPWTGFLSSLTLPLSGFTPVPQHLTQFYHTAFNPTAFWGTVNMLYWLYWVNIVLGVTNALPLLILDGNQFFVDTFTIAGRRKRLSFLAKEKVLNRIMAFLNVMVIFLLLWELIVPRIL